jgi:hypothetical protein
MTRYFEKFYNDEPLVEVSEATARERGTYTVEDDTSMRRYRRFIDGRLDAIIYAGWDDAAAPLADFRDLNAGVEAQIFSPVVRLAHGGRKWRTWYVNASGNVKKILEPEFDTRGEFIQESLRSPDGELVSYTVYHYDRDGYLLELVTHAPDGTVTSRQDA